MELKVINIFVLMLIVLVVKTTALPKDSSVVKQDSAELLAYNHDVSSSKVSTVDLPAQYRNEDNVIGRVACEHEEPTEDPICQEHCFPKGYKYGLCTSKVCSCI